jgi:uncharacterized RDD family membrane protein YckC
VYAAAACVGGLAFGIGYGWTNWIIVYWLFLWLVGWLSNTLATTEWTITGHELRRRPWFSWPGSESSAVMELGPQLEIVHETRGGWRIRPYGPAIYVARGQAASLTAAMERTGVRVNDWRGDWERRHRLLNAIGVLAVYGGAVAVFVAAAFAPTGPGSGVGFAAVFGSLGVMMLGFASDLLPWRMTKPSAQDAGWPPLPAGARDGSWAKQVQVGPAPGLAFGGFWLRVGAYIIDVILLGIVGSILSLVLGVAGQAMAGLIFMVYFIALWGTAGQTIGMMLLGLHVVRDVDGGKIRWGTAVLRLVGLFVAFACLYIGVIWVAFDPRKRGWHDRIGGTVVVRNIG